MNAKLLSLLLVVLCAACAGTSPAPDVSYYLLGAEPSPPPAGCEAKLGELEVPGYLRRSHIVVATGDNEITPANAHRWAEPLGEALSRVLSQCLDGTQPVNVRIEALHGSTSGAVVLRASWPDGEQRRRFNRSEPQGVSGYDALVSKHNELLRDLCSSICQ